MNKDAPTSTQTWLSERQLADHLQISVRHLHNLRQAGLPHILLGSTVRYDLAEVEAFSRLVDAVRALAKTEGLVCMTPGEFARAVAQQIAQRSIPATDAPAADTPADDDSPAALAARFAAITDPRAQTAFWRSLTAEQRAAILKAQ